MKKFLLTMAVALTALFATAQTTSYTDNLVVTIDSESTDPQETTIYVEDNGDGTFNLSLNKFELGGMIKVGNIVLNNVAATEKNGVKSFETAQNIIITAGDENEDEWIGPMLGEVPVDIKGKMTDEKLYCNIDIDMSGTLGQVINVVFGTEFEEEKKEVKSYTDNLVVTIDSESTDPQETTIYVEDNGDGTFNLSLNKFELGGMIKVGNIVLNNVAATEKNGVKSFETAQNIIITAGDENEDEWIGPMLGEVPVDIKGKMTDEKLYCNIDIDMSGTLGQVINVVFGTEFEEEKKPLEVVAVYPSETVEVLDAIRIEFTEEIVSNYGEGGKVNLRKGGETIVITNIVAEENILILTLDEPVTVTGTYGFTIGKGKVASKATGVEFGGGNYSVNVVAPVVPEIDLNKAYRVKNVETDNYLNVSAYNADNTTGPIGSVTIAEAAVNGDQIFKVEEAGDGKYYLVSLNGHYIVCRPWNVDACDNGQKTVLGFEFINETVFNITCEKGYFKVENVSGVTYPFCDAPADKAATWILEEIEVPEGIINVVENIVKSVYDLTGRKIENITKPGIYIINGKKCIVK